MDNFSKLIHLLRKKYPDACHIITHALDDSGKAIDLAAAGGAGCHAIGTNTIKEVGALQLKCQLFVTVDGAPNHLSAALGIPTLTLFGGSDPIVWGPWGPRNRAIKKSDHINDIAPQDVFQKAVEMIDNPAPR